VEREVALGHLGTASADTAPQVEWRVRDEVAQLRAFDSYQGVLALFAEAG
jgi:hypothetical protein